MDESCIQNCTVLSLQEEGKRMPTGIIHCACESVSTYTIVCLFDCLFMSLNMYILARTHIAYVDLQAADKGLCGNVLI
jgi:hypothetical protein